MPGVDTLFVYDVAQQWREMTGKPCVLAVWAGRREVVTPEVVADFLASKEYGLSQIGEIAEGAALKLDLPPRHLERYLRENIDFSLDAENLDGPRALFSRAAPPPGLIPRARPIEFAPLPRSEPEQPLGMRLRRAARKGAARAFSGILKEPQER